MILIGGLQPRTARLGRHPRACPSCSHFDLYVIRIDQYISLFFIPLLRVKKGVPFLACEHCRAVFTQNGPVDEPGVPGKPGHPQQCGFCGKSVGTDFSYCPYCGKSL
jgi:RNA polymerase subunit RPABC4/transcription elongation factor Spt4